MARYVVRRLLQFVPMLVGIAAVSFSLIHLAPGDPIVALAGEYGNAAYYESMRARFGLDRPLAEQLGVYLFRLARGDWGISYTYGQPVMTVILSRLPATLLLMGSALILSSVTGVALGLLAARRSHSSRDLGISALCLVGHAIPVFWLAQMLILFLALQAGLFPVQGMTTARQHYRGLAHILDVMHHMALPVLVLVVHQLALTARLTRTHLLEVMPRALPPGAYYSAMPSATPCCRWSPSWGGE